MLIALVFFAPAGIFLLWKNRKYSILVRSIMSLIFGLWFILIVVAANAPADSNQIYETGGKVPAEQFESVRDEGNNEEINEETNEETKKEEKTEDIGKTENSTSSKVTNNGSNKINPPVSLEKAKVVRVIDGDTVEVELSNGAKEKVRFIGINTPESTTRIEPYGKEAAGYTKNQLTGKTVYLEKDVSDRDKHGRLLRIVWIEQPKEISESEIRAKMFNSILVLEGYAQVATYPPDVKYAEYFKKFTAEARAANKGLWALDGSSGSDVASNRKQGDTAPDNSGTQKGSSTDTGKIKGNINSKGEKIYHVPGGAYYDKTIPEVWFDTEEEAQAAGFRKSKR